jgi:hypothetical protein
MVNHPGGEESGSGVFGFFQSDLQPPFPVQLDLKKVALFGISLTTHSIFILLPTRDRNINRQQKQPPRRV